MALVLTCLMILRFGNDGHIFSIGNENDHFLAVGTFVAFSIIVPAVLMSYLLGAQVTILELFINFVASGMFIAVGVITIQQFKDGKGETHDMGLALGSLSVIASGFFLLDFVMAIKRTSY